MTIRTVSMIAIACDWPGCDAEEYLDPPQPQAATKVRGMGWRITRPQAGGATRVRCPLHKGRHVNARAAAYARLTPERPAE